MSISAKRRVDYSALVDYIQEENIRKTNHLLEEMIPKLVEYLQVTVAATEESAKECVQQAFLNVYERILGGKLNDPKSLLSYMMMTARNEYFNQYRKNGRLISDEFVTSSISEPAEQIDRLVEQERKELLFECIGELDDESQMFILYFINHPDCTTKEASDYFSLSEANVRTKKYRITHQLHSLFKMKEAVKDI
ncbi:RNA polymerase sigma factor [Rhodohalobacter barkolensis]|uniref:Sigma-70 family RNA polymerase sigma factor n=1 Tax=Rhodohalobacter barkolensis TaxID=2053187 RepID=A0A2N0VKX4_9BACT|nr:sigma-70 family RNA polymerase sigma factor [Rhodohalobacter barkolensis]PKD44830.1 sigma-70 family RNA polymerase sigma factor [Rhodohalobacter barkolensis]